MNVSSTTYPNFRLQLKELKVHWSKHETYVTAENIKLMCIGSKLMRRTCTQYFLMKFGGKVGECDLYNIHILDLSTKV